MVEEGASNEKPKIKSLQALWFEKSGRRGYPNSVPSQAAAIVAYARENNLDLIGYLGHKKSFNYSEMTETINKVHREQAKEGSVKTLVVQDVKSVFEQVADLAEKMSILSDERISYYMDEGYEEFKNNMKVATDYSQKTEISERFIRSAYDEIDAQEGRSQRVYYDPDYY